MAGLSNVSVQKEKTKKMNSGQVKKVTNLMSALQYSVGSSALKTRQTFLINGFFFFRLWQTSYPINCQQNSIWKPCS